MADTLQIAGLSNPWRAGRNSSGARLSIMSGGNNGADVLKRALAKVKPDEGGDAHFRFGKASRFTLTSPEQRTNPGASVTWPDDNNQDNEPKEQHIAEYDEVSHCWTTDRVENPDEPEDWVEVENGFRFIFQGRDDGRLIALNFKKASERK